MDNINEIITSFQKYANDEVYKVIGFFMILLFVSSMKKLFSTVSDKSLKSRKTKLIKTKNQIEEINQTIREPERLEIAPAMHTNNIKKSSLQRRRVSDKKKRYLQSALRQGIIMKEILDPPRAKKR